MDESALKCLIFNRPEEKQASLISGRDRDWNDMMNSARDAKDCEPVDSNHPLYLLYTSGTTGTPKAVVRPTGGYAVMLQWTMRYLYNVHPGEVWWSAADLGWVGKSSSFLLEDNQMLIRLLDIPMDVMVHC